MGLRVPVIASQFKGAKFYYSTKFGELVPQEED